MGTWTERLLFFHHRSLTRKRTHTEGDKHCEAMQYKKLDLTFRMLQQPFSQISVHSNRRETREKTAFNNKEPWLGYTLHSKRFLLEQI